VFENLTERLNNIFTQLRRRGKLSAADVDAAMREVRLALLEADVNYAVVKDFVARVRERSIGQEVSKALNPAQQVIKIVNEELITTLGAPERLNLTGQRPYVLMLVGLQGSGKTTAAGKLVRARRGSVELMRLPNHRPLPSQLKPWASVSMSRFTLSRGPPRVGSWLTKVKAVLPSSSRIPPPPQLEMP
jgi:signal recognition particle subunit SRP54